MGGLSSSFEAVAENKLGISEVCAQSVCCKASVHINSDALIQDATEHISLWLSLYTLCLSSHSHLPHLSLQTLKTVHFISAFTAVPEIAFWKHISQRFIMKQHKHNSTKENHAASQEDYSCTVKTWQSRPHTQSGSRVHNAAWPGTHTTVSFFKSCYHFQLLGISHPRKPVTVSLNHATEFILM